MSLIDEPITRQEMYLSYLNGNTDISLPEPITRIERYLYALCMNGGGFGGGSGTGEMNKINFIKIGGTALPIELDKSVNIPVMNKNTLGAGKPDGETITVDKDGTLHVLGGGVADNIKDLNDALNDKLDNYGNASNTTATFEESSERENIASGEKLSVIFGKVAKWFTDLKTVAFSGKYDDLEGKLVPDGESIVNAADGKMYAVGIDSTTPVGTIISYMGTEAPINYLKCDGGIYNITEYPILAQHIYNQFGRYDYWGGDGQATFGVLDLRAEFLRGWDTADRNTGSGAAVGVHQDATIFPFIYSTATGNLRAGLMESASVLPTYMDTATGNNNGFVSLPSGSIEPKSLTASYTSRPTNTAVLYCIKYQ